jgi:uracil-DNA glycosylase
MNYTDFEDSWRDQLKDFLATPYWKKFIENIHEEYQTSTVFPEIDNIFNAFKLTPFDQVKVVILGQDPYHGPNQAMGLSFSVPDEVKLPPSLQNIKKEIESDLGVKSKIKNGDLTPWAKQGVLLLNSVLTVRSNEPASHRDIGWQEFTDFVITQLSEKKENAVFILWGSFARSKKKLIDQSKHLVIESSHPSPLSAYRGFFCTKPFSQSSSYLSQHDQKPIVW